MAELSDWTCEFGGLVAGEEGSAISIVEVDGLLMLPDVRSSDLELVQRDGLYPGEDYMNGRAVTVTFEIYGSSADEFMASVNAVQAAYKSMRSEAKWRFRFPGIAAGLTGYVMCRPRRRSAPMNLDYVNHVCNVTIELFSTSPYIFGDAERSEHVSSLETDDQWITAYGSEAARPVVTITGGTNPVLHNDTGGSGFAVIHSGTVIIDSAAESVTDEYGNSLAANVVFGSVWPEYGTGDHKVRLTTDNPADDAQAAIVWRERWV